jgi:DNA-binding GntR family transcriptional regulator
MNYIQRAVHDPSAEGVSSLRSQITEALRAAIVAGELQPGQVYSAPRLGAQYGVSATPVREAMLDLLKEGLVRTVRNKGFEVLAPSPVALHDILEMRHLLEVPVVRRLAERGVREADLVALLPLAEETVQTADQLDIIGHVAADLKFHLALLDLWGNDEITESVRALRSRSRLAGLWSSENHDAMIESAHEHLTLLDLLRRRDESGAADLMQFHINRAASLWSKRSTAQ